ncbi:conserved hypothetical protein [Vibrio chagasii]|nr:conserved hypothetical protein [Vibrio chagasii]CAH7302434.1 conserved hypothetical protein [Vibrio chagasii]
MSWGIATAGGLERFVSADTPNEVVWAIGQMDFNAAPVWDNTWDGNCNIGITDTGQYHVPVVVTLQKHFSFDMTEAIPGHPYGNWFKDCQFVAGASGGHSVGHYGGRSGQNFAPCGYPEALWTETATQIIIRYVGVYSGAETSWRVAGNMQGTVYCMLVGKLPDTSIQQIPTHGINLYGANENIINFNSNYMPSNPKHFPVRPNFNLDNFRTNPGYTGDMDGGIKMTVVSPIAMCSANSQNRFAEVYPCFSADGRRIGARTQGWAAAVGQPAGRSPFAIMADASSTLRVWNASDYFDI